MLQGIVGESTINLPPGSGDLLLYILATTHQYTIPPFIFNKIQGICNLLLKCKVSTPSPTSARICGSGALH